MALSEDLNGILQGVRGALPDVRGAMVASTDGLSIASSVSGDSNRMAAMIATALGLGKRICETFGSGELAETSVAGGNGQIYIYAAGTKGVLAVSAAPGANVGLIHIECRDAAKKIATMLN